MRHMCTRKVPYTKVGGCACRGRYLSHNCTDADRQVLHGSHGLLGVLGVASLVAKAGL
jgi:hypothetical protein